MSGDGIRYYAGEFLISPAGLELSMNWCGHDCHYCFANATVPNRRADLSGIMGLLANYQQRETREARLLQAGVPMLVSNHVDVFAGTNAEQFEPIWEVCVDAGVNLTWQTRGAHKPQRRILERVIRETPKSVWYISIPFMDDEVRKRVEPKAPSIGSRLDLIDELIAAGHIVQVGVNPLSYEWMPDYEPLFNRLKRSGVRGVWVQVPYFAKIFKGNMRKEAIKAIGEKFIEDCGERGNPIDIGHARQAMEYARSIGLEVFSTQYEEPSGYFDCWHEAYDRVMPYWHQVLNKVDAYIENSPEPLKYAAITFDAAMEMMAPLPDGIDWGKLLHRKWSKRYREMVQTKEGERLPKMGVNEFWRAVWNDDFYAKSMGLNSFNKFAHAAVIEDGEPMPILDENKNKLMVYRREGWKYTYANTPELAE